MPLITTESKAKSLYVGMHDPLAIRAYRISGNQLQYQTDAQGYSSGWTGMTLDPNLGMAFLTAEGSNYIYLLDARTMIFEDSTTETYGGAGVVFDPSKQKLYAVGRRTLQLYVYL